MSLGVLVAGIAHEINNPVSFIYGNLAQSYCQNLITLVNRQQEHPNPSQVTKLTRFSQAIGIS